MFTFTVNEFIKAYSLLWAIEKSLVQSTELIRWKAVRNAPYLTWTLRRSITTKVTMDTWIIWTNVKYAKVREYVNKKNPHKKFYMKRALDSSVDKVNQIFLKNISDVFNNK